jgi:hypothetical protein
MLEVVMVDAHDRVAEHVDQPAIAVVGEALVAGEIRQALHDAIVHADVEDRIHHAGHGELRARSAPRRAAGSSRRRIFSPSPSQPWRHSRELLPSSRAGVSG